MQLLDYDKFCEDLPRISSSRILKKNRMQFHEDGLFSEQIFGPVKNYTCQCGIYHGSFRSGGICKICGVPIVKANERRKRYAAIKLPLPIYNPMMIETICNLAGTNFRHFITTLLTKRDSVLVVDKNDSGEYDVKIMYQSELSEDADAQSLKLKSYEAVDTLINSIMDKDEKWDVVRDNINLLKINYVIVIPPDLRPSLQVSKKVFVDDINKSYTTILHLVEAMNATNFIEQGSALEHKYFVDLQVQVNNIFNFVLDKISKKTGLIRGNILGKRIDFSGRSVISPDPVLGFDECSLPYSMAVELFKIEIAKELREKGMLINEAIDLIENSKQIVNEKIYKVLEKIVKDRVCIINRQPSLHRASMIALKIKINRNKTICINPFLCSPLAGDFDGDTVAVHIPLAKEVIDEAKENMLFSKNLILPSTNKLCTYPSQDMVIGIHEMTNKKIGGSKQGWDMFKSCFPNKIAETIEETEEGISKKDLVNLLNKTFDLCTPEETVMALENLKREGFKYSTIFGTTLSLDLLPDMKDLRDEMYSKKDTLEQLKTLLSKELNDEVFNRFPMSYIVKSGARGNIEQLKQLVLSRGFISNFRGDILTNPVKSSLVQGLTEREFFNSTYGCRKGLLDVAINTGASGYLSRKIMFVGLSLELDDSVQDCGAKSGLVLDVLDKKYAMSLVGRWMFNEDRSLTLIDKELANTLVGKTIEIRSPMYCKNLKVCRKCYGEAPRQLHSPYIGVIAAQSIGEINTQLVLRTFHTSGVAMSQAFEDMKQQDIVGDLSVVSKLFHSKENIPATELVRRLYTIYRSKKDILHVHFECIVANMMWHGDTHWRLQDKEDYELISVLQVPIRESLLMAIAFSHPKSHLVKAIRQERESCYEKNIVDKLLLGESL